MKMYKNPRIEIGLFDMENIVTQSGNVTNADVVENTLVSSGVSANAVETYTFDELINAQ